MATIADEMLASLEEFSASLEAELQAQIRESEVSTQIRNMTEDQYFWYMVSQEEFDDPNDFDEPDDAPLVFGKGNRDRRIELAKEGLCSFCRPHRGDNRTWHRPKPDRHKNHRRS